MMNGRAATKTKPMDLVRLDDFHFLRDLLWESGAKERNDIWMKKLPEYVDSFLLKVDLIGSRTGSRFCDWADLLIFKLWILESRKSWLWTILKHSWLVIVPVLFFMLELGFRTIWADVPDQSQCFGPLFLSFGVTFLVFGLWSWIWLYGVVRWVNYLDGGNDLAMSADPWSMGRIMAGR